MPEPMTQLEMLELARTRLLAASDALGKEMADRNGNSPESSLRALVTIGCQHIELGILTLTVVKDRETAFQVATDYLEQLREKNQ